MVGFFIKEIHAKAKWDSMEFLFCLFCSPPLPKKATEIKEIDCALWISPAPARWRLQGKGNQGQELWGNANAAV